MHCGIIKNPITMVIIGGTILGGITAVVLVRSGAAVNSPVEDIEPGNHSSERRSPHSAAPTERVNDASAAKPLTTHLALENVPRGDDLCGISSLKGGLAVPESCRGKSECDKPPLNLDIQKCTELYLNANKLIATTEPTRPSIADDQSNWENQGYQDNIDRIESFNNTFMLLNKSRGEVKYILLHSEKHNQTIRTVSCKAEGKVCMKGTSSSEYIAKAVQQYSKVVIDAIEVNHKYHNVVKLEYEFKSGCSCKYFSKN